MGNLLEGLIYPWLFLDESNPSSIRALGFAEACA